MLLDLLHTFASTAMFPGSHLNSISNCLLRPARLALFSFSCSPVLPRLSPRFSASMSTTNKGFTAPPVEEKPWHAAFPSPTSTPARVEAEELKQWMEEKIELDGRDWVVVDVRRTDFEVSYKSTERDTGVGC